MLCGLPGSCCGLTVLLFKGLICKVPEIPANFQFFWRRGSSSEQKLQSRLGD